MNSELDPTDFPLVIYLDRVIMLDQIFGDMCTDLGWTVPELPATQVGLAVRVQWETV